MSPEESELAARFFDDDLGGMDHALPPLDGYLPSELVGDLDQSGHGGAAPSAIFDETQPPQPTTSLKKRKQDALSGALPEEENPKALKSSGKDESASDDAGASKRQQTATASVPQNQKQRSSCVVAQPPEEVAGFVRTLFTLLRVCDPQIVSWSSDGSAMLIHDPARFAGEVCPKFFRHRNFNSFTRLLNMYQFHKVPSTGRDKAVVFVHPCFKRDGEDNLSKIQRKGANRDDKGNDAKTKRGAAASKQLNPTQNASSFVQDDCAASSQTGAVASVKQEHTKSPPPTTTTTRQQQQQQQQQQPAPPPQKNIHSAPKKNTAPAQKGEKAPKRAPSMFPSTAHYRAAAGTPEALIGRDVWERTNAEINELEKKNGFLSQSTVGGSSAVSTWMRRVVELEKESRRLKAENERLRGVQSEIDGLRSQLQLQQDYIQQLQNLSSSQQQQQQQKTQSAARATCLSSQTTTTAEDPVEKMTAALLQQTDDADALASTFYAATMPSVWQQMLNAATATNGDAGAAFTALLGSTKDDAQNPSDDAVTAANAILADPAAMHLFLNCLKSDSPTPSSLGGDGPFHQQCLAQCFASCGQLPSTV